MAAGCTFVVVSRLRSLTDGIFEPITFQRLASIGNMKWLKQRLTEERLRELAQSSYAQYSI